MDAENIMFSLSTMQWIVMSAIGVYSWLIGRQAASAKELLDLRMRLTAIEAEMQQVPKHAHMAEMLARMERLDARLGGVEESIKPIARQLEKINDYLLRNK